MGRIALVCSVELEASPLLELLDRPKELSVGRRRGHTGLLWDVETVVLPCGMGKTNAAQGLTALLEREEIQGVLGFGVAGAYPGRGLETGDVALATSEHYGDEGVETGSGWLSCQGIGIPLLTTADSRFYNDFPLDEPLVRHLAGLLGDVVIGPFVTVSACSGTAARGAALKDRFEAVCETMEGAAYAHVAAHYGHPFLEVRGISNLVEDRDLSRWRLREAAAAAAGAAASLLQHWNP